MSMINCPNCGAQVPAGAAFCDNCGTPLAGVPARPGAGAASGAVASQSRCPNCGENVMPGEAFCGNCGTPLTPSAPTAYVPPPAASSSPPAASSSPGWPSTPPAASSSPSWSPPAPPIQREAEGPVRSAATCPNCGMPVQPSDVFCDNCGQALTPISGFPRGQQEPAVFSSDPSVPIITAQPVAPDVPVLNPRLVVQASGATLNLPPGKSEYLIGREDPVSGSFPDVDLVPYGGEEGGVSRRHAQIGSRAGQFTIEDLNSVNYTFVNRQKVAPGTPHPLRDGDEIRLGRVVLQFKTS